MSVTRSPTLRWKQCGILLPGVRYTWSPTLQCQIPGILLCSVRYMVFYSLVSDSWYPTPLCQIYCIGILLRGVRYAVSYFAVWDTWCPTLRCYILYPTLRCQIHDILLPGVRYMVSNSAVSDMWYPTPWSSRFTDVYFQANLDPTFPTNIKIKFYFLNQFNLLLKTHWSDIGSGSAILVYECVANPN